MEKKTIKIKYVGFWDEFDPESFYMTILLRKHFIVNICDDPDFVICSCIGDFYSFLDYPQVRIEYIGENYIPDLNMIDYAITPYPISFLDRCFHLPQGLRAVENTDYCTRRSKGLIRYDKKTIESKDRFANFCASHESENGLRGSFFHELCKYKKVDSIGSFLNNTGIVVKRGDGSKIKYQRRCKFTLCFESTVHGGFNTEKIVDAFCADTIPVYYGDPYIGTIFNEKAYVNVAAYDSFEKAIEKIIELDQNDDLFLQMLNEPVFLDSSYAQRMEKDYEQYLVHIFEQEPAKAYRRSRAYFAKYYEAFVRNARKLYYFPVVQGLLKIKRAIK